MSQLDAHIAAFQPISLNEMDAVALMNRIDTKYLVPRSSVAEMLDRLTNDYRALTITDKRLFQYRTIYFDTSDKQMLHEHLRGKLNREKIRTREYVGTNTRFLEVKFKTNKGRTIKKRVKKVGEMTSINQEETAFLEEQSAFKANTLAPVITVSFKRVTLVSNDLTERITLDFGLTFQSEDNEKAVEDLVIVEMKRDSQHANDSVAAQVLKDLSAHPSSLSKYCIGMILLNETGKYNRYKPKLLKLNKLSTHGDIW